MPSYNGKCVLMYDMNSPMLRCCTSPPRTSRSFLHPEDSLPFGPSWWNNTARRAKRAHPCESAIANISSVDLNQAVNKWLNIYWKNIVKDYSLTFHSEVPFPVCKHGGRKCAAKSCIFGDISCINISTFKPRLVYKPLKNLSLEHGTSIYLHEAATRPGSASVAAGARCVENVTFQGRQAPEKNARGYNELVFLHNNQG